MILQTGMRTDIPAFYSDWFAHRLQAGYVLVRNPYNPGSVTKYRLDPSVVDLIGFCTKNPGPMLKYMDLLKPYGMYWFVTINGYGREIEPGITDRKRILSDFKTLSRLVGTDSIAWRYDPVFISEDYPADFHLDVFAQLAEALEGSTKTCVISFIDLYEKVKRNFPRVRAVTKTERLYIGERIVKIAASHGMKVKPCGEGTELAVFGADCSGCLTEQTYEDALHMPLSFPKRKPLRKECACFLGNDIGAYNCCPNLCRYCYANYDERIVHENFKKHDPWSPFLIGKSCRGDVIHEADQKSWVDGQMSFDFL